MIKGALVLNKYYSDDGLCYMQTVLKEKFLRYGIELCNINAYAEFGLNADVKGLEFVLFFDKDIYLAHRLESMGLRLINSAKTIEICDDKIKTYSAVFNSNVSFPKTICAPLMFDVNNNTDTAFLDYVETQLHYPIIVKENTGSQGRQVYLAVDRKELVGLYSRLKRVPHHYQEFVSGTKGEDIRIYIVGKKAVASAKRQNTTDFRSNVCMGASLNVIDLPIKLADTAEKIAQRLNLEYGSVDFMCGNGYSEPVFIEANSNAYFRAIESAGVNISDMLIDYIVRTVQYDA